jgi:hypothetical protein
VKLPNLLSRRGRSVDLRADRAAMHIDDAVLNEKDSAADWHIAAAAGTVKVVWPSAA